VEIEPADLRTLDRYKLLIGCVVPRPIALVSTISADGRPNLAPFSFFNAVGSDPMTLLFCPGNRADGAEKDTLRNARPPEEGGVGEFVVHASTEAIARRMVAASADLEYGESEFELVGLTPVASRVVKPPRVKESPVAFECETTQVIRTNPGAPLAGNVVLGRVVWIHVAEELLNERRHVDPEKLRAVGRMGGLGYATTRDRFELPRGRAALEADDPFAPRRVRSEPNFRAKKSQGVRSGSDLTTRDAG
jgi:flavin reductase (DIM6/NTAB) family NADH-FMN oxidoreductase RutF